MIRETGFYVVKMGKFEKYAIDIDIAHYEYFEECSPEWRLMGIDYAIDERCFTYISPKKIDLDKLFESCK